MVGETFPHNSGCEVPYLATVVHANHDSVERAVPLLRDGVL